MYQETGQEKFMKSINIQVTTISIAGITSERGICKGLKSLLPYHGNNKTSKRLRILYNMIFKYYNIIDILFSIKIRGACRFSSPIKQ